MIRTFVVISRVNQNFTRILSRVTSIQHATYHSTFQNMADSSPSDIVTMSEGLNIDEKSERGARGGKRGGRGKHNRGNLPGSGRRFQNREVAISMALSKLLRHAAKDEGLAFDAEGFARLDQVMQWQRLKSLSVEFEDIRVAVTDNAKQRFSMKLNPALPITPDPESQEPSDWVIRANQGHSIIIESAAHLVPISIEGGNVPELVIHGTYYALYQAILDTGGLKSMGRHHIHFSTGLPEDKQGVVSGMRNDVQILIYIDIQKSLADGGVFWWMSENGVVLTEGDENGLLGTKYWKKVVSRKHGLGILWEEGKQVADLPQSLQNKKAPNGKGGRKGGQKSKAKSIPKEGQNKSNGVRVLEAAGEVQLGMGEPSFHDRGIIK